MRNNSKTKAQLIAELESLKRRVAKLEISRNSKKPVRRIQEYPEIHHVLMENTPQIIFLKNKDLVYVSCNDNFARALGRTFDKVCGVTDYELFPKALAEKYRTDDRTVLQTGQVVDTEETFVNNSYVHTFKTLVKDEDGEIIGVLGTGYDVTKQKLTEQQLKERREKLEKLVQLRTLKLKESEIFSSSLLRNSPNPIIVANPDSSIRYVNPALERLTGYTRSELVGRKAPYPWWTDLDRVGKDFEKALHHGMNGMEALFESKNGEQFWVKINAAVIESNKGKTKYYLAIWTDTTEQKRLTEDLQFYLHQLTKAQEEERKRIARELHDDTLQALFGLRQDIDKIVRSKGRLLNGEESDQLCDVQNRIQSIMYDVRHFSHELRPDMLDTFGLIPALEMLVGEYDQKGEASCCLQISGAEKRLTPEAELALFRITQEALHNARKHSGATGIMVRVTFDSERVILKIIDDGIGFAVPPKLSDFTHMGKLGLVGMSERARSLNGKFSINSEVNKSTEIEIDIPVSSALLIV